MNGTTMKFLTRLLLAVAGLACAASAFPEDLTTDDRQLVEMPAQTQEMMRQKMQDHLTVLSQIIAYLADNDLPAAAEIAEQRLGMSSMGKHRGTGMGPGKFMPKEMKQIGRGMHQAASRLADAADRGDLADSYSALQGVVASCAACHSGFRIR